MADTVTESTITQARPQYIQDIDQALLGRIFGTPLTVGQEYISGYEEVTNDDGTTSMQPVYKTATEQDVEDYGGTLFGGIIDDPELFNIPDYVQAGADPLQAAVTATLGDATQRQAFMDRYLPYFQDATGKPRYLPEAGAELATGAASIEKALTDYFPDAKSYLSEGRGTTGVKGIYDTALSGVRDDIGKGTQTFDAQGRATSLLGDAQSTLKGGLGQFTTDPSAYDAARAGITGAQGQFGVDEQSLRGGTKEYQQSGGLADARANLEGAAGGEFGAREAFERGTGRAFELAEQGLGKFDPSSAAQSFMDPYKEQVIDAALAKINREGAKQRQKVAAQAIGAGAFGGSRAGVQAAETQRAIEETKQQTVANLMSQGYDKAMANAMATDEAARKRALQASGLTGQLGAQGTSLEARAYEDAAKRGLAAASTSAGLSQAEEQMRQKAFESSQTRALQAEQQINVAKQKAFEDAKARGLTGAQLETAVARAEETARQQAYEDSMKRQLAGGQELGRLGTTQLGAEAQAFESGEDRMLKAADMYRSMGLSSAEAQARAAEDEKKRSLEAGRLMGGLGQTYGQIGGAQADIGQAYGQLAGTAADIGRVYAGMQPADMQFMYELGGKERQYDQQAEDFARQNILSKTQQALAPYSYGQTFVAGSPSASMYSQYTQTPQTQVDPFWGGVGAYAQMQGLNQMG